MDEPKEYAAPRLIDLEGRLLKRVLLELRPLTEMLQQTIGYCLSLREPQWSFAELAIEAMFQVSQQHCLRNGVVLTREEFWRAPGHLIMTVPGYRELMRAGVSSMALQQVFARPRDPLGIQRKKGN
jgi:hypothetical protein